MIAETGKNRAEVLSGAPVAEAIKQEAKAEIAELIEKHNIRPGLAVVRVGEDSASAVYVGNKVKTSAELGIHSEHIHLSADATHEEVLKTVKELNNRDDIDGILVQTSAAETNQRTRNFRSD